MATLSVSSSNLPQVVKSGGELLLAAGCITAGTNYQFSSKQLPAAKLSLTLLSTLLTTGLPGTGTQQGLIHSYALDKRTGDVTFSLNYDLVP